MKKDSRLKRIIEDHIADEVKIHDDLIDAVR